MQNNLTTGNLLHTITKYAIPYLIACFLQTFYGLADLFITGQFSGAAAVTAVSVGSQVTHMLTVAVVGLAMGTSVCISHAVGAQNSKLAAKYIGNSISIFAIVAAVLTVVFSLLTGPILTILHAPAESFASAVSYLRICFIGIPFITAYNVISSIFRGLGDSKSPMIFVGIAGVLNVLLDYVLIGPLGMGATGAALATVASQAFSVCISLIYIRRVNTGVKLSVEDLRFNPDISGKIVRIGTPIACQESFIQISFLVITMIANSRGLEVATAVGIVEKVISFLFLVPSAMLSTVSAITAQSVGAGDHARGRKALLYGIRICIIYGALVFVVCVLLATPIVRLFIKDEPEVVRLGAQYLKTYSIDCMLAGVHFCFSGYFSAYGKSLYTFTHNVLSVILVRIPGAYLASILFPATLYPMGMAAPLGSLLSILICLWLSKSLRTSSRA